MRQMYKPENIEIGGRIRSARETHGMTRDEFAEAVGISSQLASDLERGRMGASVETILPDLSGSGYYDGPASSGQTAGAGDHSPADGVSASGVSPCYHPHLLAILREEIKLIGLAEGQR